MSRPWLWLYRPTVPTPRAQAIQVMHMAHAMASRGHEVTLAVELAGGRLTETEILAYYGLSPLPRLKLAILPANRLLASVAFRAMLASWVVRSHGEGIVYARSKRYARELLRLYGWRFRLILEAHEVDSLQAVERGCDPRPWRALETEVLASARGVVTNAPGTLALLRDTHRSLPPAVALQNATHANRVRRPEGPGEGIGYVGSIRETKDLRCLATAASKLPWPVHLVGATTEEARELMTIARGRLCVEPPIPHCDVPDRLCRFRVLVLPLGTGLFGEHLSSPLKLWDYLASGVPIVAADLPSLQEAAPGMFHPYISGDAASLERAISDVMTDEVLRKRLLGMARVRTWAERAEEVERFVESVL